MWRGGGGGTCGKGLGGRCSPYVRGMVSCESGTEGSGRVGGKRPISGQALCGAVGRAHSSGSWKPGQFSFIFAVHSVESSWEVGTFFSGLFL